MRMARAVAAIASDGTIREDPLVATPSAAPAVSTAWIGARTATILRGAMREAVVSGTGRVLARHAVPIAGKTGTAEVGGAAAHSWFVGFAPAAPRAGRRIAFAVVVENAGYGGRTAAPLAGDIVTAAAMVGLIK
jgi:peptidoglycan glycosyltransferase